MKSISIIGLLITFSSITSANYVTVYYKAIPKWISPKPNARLVKRAVLESKNLYLLRVYVCLELVGGGVEEKQELEWSIWDYNPDLEIYCKIDCTSSHFISDSKINQIKFNEKIKSSLNESANVKVTKTDKSGLEVYKILNSKIEQKSNEEPKAFLKGIGFYLLYVLIFFFGYLLYIGIFPIGFMIAL